MKPLNKSLDTGAGEKPDDLTTSQKETATNTAALGSFGKEYRDKAGCLQLLTELADSVRGFDNSIRGGEGGQADLREDTKFSSTPSNDISFEADVRKEKELRQRLKFRNLISLTANLDNKGSVDNNGNSRQMYNNNHLQTKPKVLSVTNGKAGMSGTITLSDAEILVSLGVLIFVLLLVLFIFATVIIRNRRADRKANVGDKATTDKFTVTHKLSLSLTQKVQNEHRQCPKKTAAAYTPASRYLIFGVVGCTTELRGRMKY
ncbi:unnamed protein product [Toxocara canis]|uniref:Uncharacterized protein n=1 Tax=Toxocara canis TaxID=6265 RepID=A0A183UBQ8_TOXCA|nr:unnamed protein product [Toxocara canis]